MVSETSTTTRTPIKKKSSSPGLGSPAVRCPKEEKMVIWETMLPKYQVRWVTPKATNIIPIKEMISFTRSEQRGNGIS